MLSRYSVKKPYTVLVAVVLVLVLGVVSFLGMTTDLLPSLELPYIIVVTTYPGASPEKVEASVTRPLESVLGTTSGVKNISSVSSENSSMIILEFEQGTNMDSATIELSGNVDLVSGQLDDAVGAPMFLTMSPDMLPVMVASVDMDGKDVREVSSLVSGTVTPAFERLDGVASVSETGLVEQQVSVTMDKEKIDALNSRVLASVDETLSDAQRELANGRAQVNEGQQKLDEGKAALLAQKDNGLSQLASASAQVDTASAQLSAILSEETTLTANQKAFEAEKAGLQQAKAGYDTLNAALQGMGSSVDALLAMSAEDFSEFKELIVSLPTGGQFADVTQESLQTLKDTAGKVEAGRLAEIDAELNNISTRLAVISGMKPQLEEALKKAQDAYAQLESGKMTAVNEMTKGEITLQNTEAQLEQARQQLDSAQQQFEEARDAAYERADLSGMLTPEVLSSLLAAQNFEMPAGYVDNGADGQLVKVGDALGSVEDVENLVLMHLDAGDIGDVRVGDVATVALTDNAGESYARVNGNDAVVLMFQKQSTASTSTVSEALNDEIAALQAEYEGLHITPLMDQGDYIALVVDSVMSNLLWGGALAILVLILFLRDARPTLIVACSIPFSLLCAVTLMYFSGVTLNLISLSGLALGVGMLVDNSIVVIENIYRLRSEGVPAARAAVLGANQVAGAIFASTLTTICVFLPIVFTQGLSRELFTDMGLTIAYSLLASLAVALTLVPAMGATALRSAKQKELRWFEKFVNWYEMALRWSLRHRLPVLGGALALLVFACAMVPTMGTGFIPSMNSPQMSATLTMPKEANTAETYAMADDVMEALCTIDGVETVGAMDGGGTTDGASSSTAHTISFYLLLKEDGSVKNSDVKQAALAAAEKLGADLSVEESTMDMSMLGGSGLELVVHGQDLDSMNEAAGALRGILHETEGVTDISEAATTGTPEVRITVDKSAAMRYNLTTAQIYADLAQAVANETTSTTLTVGADSIPVVVLRGGAGRVTRDNLMNYTFDATNAEGETQTVRLGDIAALSEADSVPSIRRENGQRTMSVTAGVDDAHNIGLVSRDVQRKLDGYTPPAGCTITLEGENESINSAMLDLVKMLLLAVVFIYLIMVAQFQSLLSPFIVMFNNPLALTGGLLALLITGKELSIIAMLGFLVLAGVVVNNGIVFVDTINQLRLEGMPRFEAIVRTGRTRIRPVLMTALTTILAMSTMAMAVGQGAEMTQPMAIVTIGGLTYATLLTLVVVPVLYDIFCRKAMKQADVDEAPGTAGPAAGGEAPAAQGEG